MPPFTSHHSQGSRARRVLAVLGLAAAAVWAATIVTLALLVTLVDDALWVTSLLVYLPRHMLLIPVGLCAVALLARGTRTALVYLAVVGGFTLVFAGFRVPLARPDGPGALRVLTFNVSYGYGGIPPLLAEIDAARADLVLLQSLSPRLTAQLDLHFDGHGWHTYGNTEFYVASRAPIESVREYPQSDRRLRPAFTQYTIASPLGRMDVFNVHLLSPRAAIDSLRGSRRHLLSRQPGNPRAEIEVNTRIRAAQARALADAIGRAPNPVLAAGDFNLPAHSRIFARHFGFLRDGWDEAGRGLGYTYPANVAIPWMRIDRVLASGPLSIVDATVQGNGRSDHRALVADVAAGALAQHVWRHDTLDAAAPDR